MSELESRFVKRGYWVNLSHGQIMGQTITTDSRTGAIVVALVAVITSLGMTHLWHLFTFFYHQMRATGRPRNSLFRHQQALLRTLPTPGTFLADLVKLLFAWRGVAPRYQAFTSSSFCSSVSSSQCIFLFRRFKFKHRSPSHESALWTARLGCGLAW